jgi:polysaccharide export outer membrane protein
MAIWPAVVAVIPVLCFGAETLEQQPVEQAALAQDISNPVLVKQALPSAEGGDPSKLAPPPVSGPGAVNNDKSYVIGAEDVLSITIWGDNRIGGSFLVRPDGRISMSLLGEVQATGRTPAEMATDISDVLKQREILKKPQVNVMVTAINSKKYFLNGEVNKTGSFPLVVPTTVLEALVNAGGFKDFAKATRIEVIRGQERFRFNYKDAIKGKHPEQNIQLKPGDIIIVP